MINKKNILKLSFLFLVLLVLIVVFRQRNILKGPTAPSGVESVYRGVSVGKTTETEIVEALGAPTKETVGETGKVFEYSSKSPAWRDRFYIKDGSSYLIKEVVGPNDERVATYYKSRLGEPEIVLYGKESSAGFHLFSYPSKGIAFIASEKKGILLEVWYFAPTTEDFFRESIAFGYQNEPEELQ